MVTVNGASCVTNFAVLIWRVSILLFITMLVVAGAAQAANKYLDGNTKDVYITDDGIYIKPVIEIGVSHDDNIFSQPSDTKGSSIVVLQPAIEFAIVDELNSYFVELELEQGLYQSSSDDNYLDGRVLFGSHYEHNSRHQFDIGVQAEWLTESRGSGLTEGESQQFSEPVTYFRDTFTGKYTYGAKTTQGRVEINGKYYQKNYTNFNEFTRTSDYDSVSLASTFFYSTNAYTDLFIDVSAETIRYAYTQPFGIGRDSDVYTTLLGANWDASRMISGFAKFGYQWKQFSDQRRENFAGLRWDIGLQWLPLSYSKVNFTTAQQTKDPDVNGDYVLESSYKVDWQHYWTSFVKTTLAFEYEKEDYSGVDRIDDRNQVLLGVDYEFSNWFTINIFAEVINSDSTQDNFIYDKQIIGGNLIFTL